MLRRRRLWQPLLRHRCSSGGKLAPAYLPPADYAPRPQQQPALAALASMAILFPPPNVTGKLHLGHALTVTIQDAWVRYQRLRGRPVRWIHGLDHAGIATQTVVERNLAKLGQAKPTSREEFEQHAWEWTARHRGFINAQLALLGASLDYEHEYFTLDEPRREAVAEAFCRLADANLVYRALRMVNWCPHLQTAVSDLEVEHVELDRPTTLELPSKERVEFGVIDEFAYAVLDPPAHAPSHIAVQTTRLETMLGDVAVVVHPEDARYAALHGRQCVHPLTGARLRILCDAQLADPSKGTGAVKLTPAHDENDLQAGQRLGLAVGERVFGEDGRIVRGEFAGQTRFQCRVNLRARLAEMGAYRGKTPHKMALARCSRSGDVIEPLIKPQWYVAMDALARGARQCALEFYPPDARNDWDAWTSHVNDWCVSRQLWWGHRIPAWRVRGTGEARWVVAKSRAEAAAKLGCEDATAVEQDDDVLDTWFSSGLLPLSVNGWPTHAEDGGGGGGYPLALMETGSDILFFWVARMVMLCTFLHPAKQAPFPRVHLHSMVRDKHNRKMSKSLGNVVDPAHVIRGAALADLVAGLRGGNLAPSEVARAEADLKRDLPQGIPACGTDALRLGLASYPAASASVCFDVERVVLARQLCNKIWQACRFAEARGKRDAASTEALEDVWIMSRLAAAAAECAEAYNVLDVHAAQAAARRFFVSELCDVYVELCKTGEGRALVPALRGGLALFYPLAPGLVDAVSDAVGGDVVTWPAANEANEAVDGDVGRALRVVRAIRLLAARVHGLGAPEFVVDCASMSDDAVAIARRLSRVDAVRRGSAMEGALVDVLPDGLGAVGVRMSVLADAAVLDAQAQRLRGKLAASEEARDKLAARLASAEFAARAPAEVRRKEEAKLAAMMDGVAAARSAVDALDALRAVSASGQRRR